jgi:hypothetical protein
MTLLQKLRYMKRRGFRRIRKGEWEFVASMDVEGVPYFQAVILDIEEVSQANEFDGLLDFVIEDTWERLREFVEEETS